MISFLFVAFLILNIQAFDVPIRTSTLSVKYPSSRLENSFNLFHIKRWNAATDYKTTNTGLYRGIQQNKSQNHPLFSSNGSEIDGSKKPSSVRQNLHVLARLSISGILAYAYMNYFAFATFGSLGYYLFQKTVSTTTTPAESFRTGTFTHDFGVDTDRSLKKESKMASGLCWDSLC